MEVTNTKVTRSNIYKSESVIMETLGDKYNNTMSHRMKERDTFKNIFPTADLWDADSLFKTTNNITKPSSYRDPNYDEKFHLRADFNKKYYEEMARWKSWLKLKKNEELTEKKNDN